MQNQSSEIDIKKIRQLFETNEKQEKISSKQISITKNFFEKEIKNTSIDSSQKLRSQDIHLCAQKTLSTNNEFFENNNKNDNITNFNHIRYQILKNNLSNYKNNENVQLQQLLEYLNNYNAEDILKDDNNIIIIEPIRTPIDFDKSKTKKSSTGIKSQQKFYCHPIRVNKELLESELPNPETVKQVRSYFEKVSNDQNQNPIQKRALVSTTTSSESSIVSINKYQEKQYSNSNEEYNECIDCNDNDDYVDHIQTVSKSVMEKIHNQCTSVTYFGGKVVAENTGQDSKINDKNHNTGNLKFGYDLKDFQCDSRKFNDIKFESYEVQ